MQTSGCVAHDRIWRGSGGDGPRRTGFDGERERVLKPHQQGHGAATAVGIDVAKMPAQAAASGAFIELETWMATEIYLVKVGMTMTEGIEEWYVPDGGTVKQGELLYRLETEKNPTSMPTPAAS